jgi:hypothetical protein
VSIPNLEVDAAAPGSSANLDEDYDLVARFKELLGLRDPRLKCRVVMLKDPLHYSTSPMCPGVERPWRDSHFEVRVRVAKRRVPVAAIHGVVDGPNDLHVLLRH